MSGTQQALIAVPMSPWLTSEWLVAAHSGGDRIRYISSNLAAGSMTQLAEVTGASSTSTIATDGTFVFVSAAGTAVTQWAWNGSTLTQRYSGNLGYSGGYVSQDLYCVPSNPGRLVFCDAYWGGSLTAVQYQTAPTYSYGTQANINTDTYAARQIADFRVGAIGTPTYGNTMAIIGEAGAPRALKSFTVSGTTITTTSTLSGLPAGSGGRLGHDRDTGWIGLGIASTTVPMYQVNMTTRAVSSIGSGTVAVNASGITGIKGFVLVRGNSTNTNLYCYSRSGATLTLVDTFNTGVGYTAGDYLVVSPYTNKVYMMSAGSIRAYNVSNSGTISHISTLAVSGVAGATSVRFLPAALPTV